MKKLFLFVLMAIFSTAAMAQIMLSEEGDTIAIDENFTNIEDKPWYIQNNGVVTYERITAEKLAMYEDELFTSTKTRLGDYIVFADVFDNYEDKWPLAFRCYVTAQCCINLILESSKNAVDTTLTTLYHALSAKIRSYTQRYIERDSALFFSQLDSVCATLDRMDYLGDIYSDSDFDFVDRDEVKRNIEKEKKNFSVMKYRSFNIPDQCRAIRRFLSACHKSKRDRLSLAKAAKPHISQAYTYDFDKTTNIFLTPTYWEGWDAYDYDHTCVFQIDDFDYLVILYPEDIKDMDKIKEPIAGKVFVVKVCHPTNANGWRVNMVYTIEEYQEIIDSRPSFTEFMEKAMRSWKK